MSPLPEGLDRKSVLALYYHMRRVRALEERLVRLKRQGRIAGGVYRSLGQEADSIGSAFALDRSKGDVLCPLIRNLGAVLVHGATVEEVLRQNLARATGPSRGREQSFHFADLERGFIGHIANLGDMVPVLAGIALSFRLRGQGAVALVYTGDGAMSTGAFHEGINFAAVQRLPLLVVCERNGYAYSTPHRLQTRVEQLHRKALAYGIPGVMADGNDVFEVYRATRDAVQRARAGEGATLIELVTYRRLGHAEHDNQAYVPAGEAEQWTARDPLSRYEQRVAGAGWADPGELRSIDAAIEAELDQAIATVEAEPEVLGVSALGGVLAREGAQPEWYRRLDG